MMMEVSKKFTSVTNENKMNGDTIQTKKPNTYVLGFSLVTQVVDKSNFYKDLEGVGDIMTFGFTQLNY